MASFNSIPSQRKAISAPILAAHPVLLAWSAALALLLLGLGLRLYDLTDPPLDFHYTRQLRGAVIARGIYYELLPNADPLLREDAVAFSRSTGQYEPPILESLVAVTYLLIGGEQLWVGRLYSSLFWVLGGAALFALARRMAGSLLRGASSPASEKEHPMPGPAADLAALLALAYYLALPFGVQASRSFQPDPAMTLWLILSVYAFYRWLSLFPSENLEAGGEGSWRWAILAGLFGGLAILTKTVAVYTLAGGALGAVLAVFGPRRALHSPQLWTAGLLMLIPSALFLMFGRQGSAAEYFQNWTVSLSHLLLEPGSYVRWMNLVQDLMGLAPLLLALIGALIARRRERGLLLGLFAGYAVYGLTLPYQMYTHNYYHLQLISLLALGLVPAALPVLEKILVEGRAVRLVCLLVALAGLGFSALLAVSPLRAESFRDQPAYWQEIGALLPRDGKILALTPDYGYRLLYWGWRRVDLWPNRGEQNLAGLRGRDKQFEAFFAKRIEGKGYFLIASLRQFNEQADLKAALTQGYPVYAQGEGYIIYDLQHPLSRE